ncbi:MAG: hypothetical protein RLZZ450_4448 [Pseudomonadota bacterium]|jgi:hypothetical protein
MVSTLVLRTPKAAAVESVLVVRADGKNREVVVAGKCVRVVAQLADALREPQEEVVIVVEVRAKGAGVRMIGIVPGSDSKIRDDAEVSRTSADDGPEQQSRPERTAGE